MYKSVDEWVEKDTHKKDTHLHEVANFGERQCLPRLHSVIGAASPRIERLLLVGYPLKVRHF